MRASERIYRTNDGRHVRQGDPDAAFLAYPAGAELPHGVVDELGLKQAEKPEDKSVGKHADKARGKSRGDR